jgi:hypothetical protein
MTSGEVRPDLKVLIDPKGIGGRDRVLLTQKVIICEENTFHAADTSGGAGRRSANADAEFGATSPSSIREAP